LDCQQASGTFEWHPTTVEVTEEQFANPALARHRARMPLSAGGGANWTCVIVVLPSILADDGTPFDQDATSPGPDGYRGGAFQLQSSNDVIGDDCRLPPPQPGALTCDPTLTCDPATGSCVVTGACGDCAPGFACDPASSRCLEDCRVCGACLDPALQCQPSGLCS
jgi:hypothetical protein